MRIILITVVILVAVVGFVLAGVSRGRRQEGIPAAEQPRPGQPLSSDALAAIIAANDPNTLLVDVRTPEEYRSGAIPSAVNVPYDVIRERLPSEDRSAQIIVYCRSGSRSGVAARTLESLGFTNVVDFGGIGRWTGERVRR